MQRSRFVGTACSMALMATLATFSHALTIYPLEQAGGGVAGFAPMGPDFVVTPGSVDDEHGNGDGVANPGEQVWVSFVLRNSGRAEGRDVRWTVETDDARINVQGISGAHLAWPAGDAHVSRLGVPVSPTAEYGEAVVVLTVTADVGGPWRFILAFPIVAPSVQFARDGITVADAHPMGDGDGVVEAGERVQVTLTLRNDGSTAATNVRVAVTVLDPHAHILVGDAVHAEWPAGETRPTSFVIDIDPDFSARALSLFFHVSADAWGPWQFSEVVSVAIPDPDFALRNAWIYDPVPAGNADGAIGVGESVRPRVRLRNVGDGAARDVEVTMTVDHPGVSVTRGRIVHGTWPASEARNNTDLGLAIATNAMPGDFTATVVVTADGAGPWRYDVPFTVLAPDVSFVFERAWVFDPAPGGNGDRRANRGERVYQRVRVTNVGADTAYGVSVALSTGDSGLSVAVGGMTYAGWPSGVSRSDGEFTLDVAADSQPHAASLSVTVTAAQGGPWVFTFTTPIHYAPVDFAVQSAWVFDPEPGADHDRLAEAGERVLPRLRIRHVGAVGAENVTVTIAVDDADVTVVDGSASQDIWPAGEALTVRGFALDIGRDAMPHDVTVLARIRSAGVMVAEYQFVFAIDAPPVDFVALELSFRDEGQRPKIDGTADAGETLRPIALLKHIGTAIATNVHVAVVVDDPDITVDTGSVIHAAWAPGEEHANDRLKLTIAEDSQPRDVAVVITVTADAGGPWLFTYVIAVGKASRFGLYQELIMDVITDGYHDRKADPGEQVIPRMDVSHSGPSVATNVRVTLHIDDPDVAIVNGVYTTSLMAVPDSRRVETFVLEIAADAQPHDVRVTVLIEADDTEPIEREYTFAIAPRPAAFEFGSAWLYDPSPGGNRDKRASPGERVLPRIRLVNTGTGAATNVRVSLVMQSGDVDVVSNLTSYSKWPGGAGRNAGDFVVDVSPAATAGDITAIVSVTADTGGPWQFTYTIPIVESAPDFAQRADWIWDPSPGGNADRIANPGESVRWALRLKNTAGSAQNAVATLVINDDDVTVVKGTVSHTDWTAKEAKTHVFVLDIAPDATAHDITATVSVTADSGGPWQFTISTPIAVPAGGVTSLLANFPNPFNPETWIPFDLSEDAETTVTIYDATGRRVRHLDLGWLPAGHYRRRTTAAYWDGRSDTGERASSGVYLVELRAGGTRQMRRMAIGK